MFRKKIALWLLPIVVGLGLGVFLLVKNVQAGTSVDGNFTILPKTVQDSRIGASDVEWVFTVTTTAYLTNATMPPDIIRFILPTTTAGVPFTVTNATSTQLSGILLSIGPGQLGVSSTVLDDGRTAIYGFSDNSYATGTSFSLTIGGINNASGTLESLQNLEWTVEAGQVSGEFPNLGYSQPLSQTKFIMTSTASLISNEGEPPAPPAGPTVSHVSNVVLVDGDTSGYGLDGRDFQVTWTPTSSQPNGYQFTQVYIVSSTATLSTSTLNSACGGQCQPVMMSPQFNMATATVPQFMRKDSSGADWATTTEYVAWVYTMAATPSITSSSVVLSPEFDTPLDTNAPQIDHNPVHGAKQSEAGNFYAFVFDDQASEQHFADTGDGGAEFFRLYYTSSTFPESPAYVDAAIVPGSGEMYSFTVPTTSLTGIALRYYLVASDRAEPASNVRYFCATQNPVSVQNCKDNPFSVTVAAGGNRSVSGRVSSNNGGEQAGLANALVFAGGYAAPAVTADGSGDYTISGLPNNDAFEFTAVKMGYNKISRMETIGTTNKSGVNLVLNQGSFGFFAGSGDDNGGAPRAVFSGPPDGMQGVNPSEKIRIGFNQPMDASSINTSDATATSSNVYLMNTVTGAKVAGTVTYCANAASPGCTDYLYEMDENTILFLPAANLATGTPYTLIINEAVKSQSGQSVQGNRSGGGHRVNFTTIGNDFSNFGGNWATQFTEGGQYMPPFVRSMSPAPGLTAANNTKVLLEFDRALDSATVISDNINLFINNVAVVGATPNLDTVEKRFVTISHDSLASGEYEVQVKGAVKTTGGIPMRSQLGEVAFRSKFYSSGSADNTAPTVYPLIANNSTGVSPDNIFEFGMNEQLAVDTITNSNITMTRGANAVSINVTYDPGRNSIFVAPNDVLAPNSVYTVVLNSNLTDLAGNALATTTYTYTTGGVNSTAPTIKEARCDDYQCKVYFTKPMNHDTQADSDWASSTLNYLRWSLTQGGEKISASTILNYDAFEKSIIIQGVGLSYNQDFTLQVSGVSDISGNLLISASVTGKTEDSKETFGSFGDAGMFGPPSSNFRGEEEGIGGGEFKPQGFGNFTADQFAMGKADMAFPFNPLASADSNVFQVRFTPGVALANDDQIVLSFPNGTAVANATFDSQSPFASDFNQFMAGTIAGTAISSDSTNNKVTITVDASGVSANDPVTIDLKKIINPPVPKGPQTGGYTVGIQVLDSNGAIKANKTSMPYYIMAGGTNTLIVDVAVGSTSTVTNGANGTVYLHGGGPGGPMDKVLTMANGQISAIDGSAGTEITYSNLPNGCYFLGTEPMVTLGVADYFGQMSPEPICVNGGESKTKAINFTAASAGNSTDLVVKWDGMNFGGKDIDIFAAGPGKFVKKTITGATVSPAEGYTIKLNANGNWFVGIGPAMSKSTSGAMPASLGAMPPPPVVLMVSNLGQEGEATTVNGTTPPGVAFNDGTVTFTFAEADKTVTGTVKDGSGNALANVEVFMHRQGFGTPVFTQTNASGVFSLAVSENGNYEIGAHKAGMPEIIRQIELRSEGGLKIYMNGQNVTGNFNLTMKKADYSISGKVLDSSNNAISNAPIFARDTNGTSVFGMTSADGSYSLFVGGGTWTVRAELPPSKTDTCGSFSKVVNVSGASQSNQNITPSASSCYILSGTVSAGGQNLSNSPLFIEEWDNLNNRPVAGGMRKSATTDSNGAYSVMLGNGTYRAATIHPSYGEIGATTTINNSSAALNISPSGSNGAVVFTFTGGTSAMKAFIELKNGNDKHRRISKQANGLDTQVAMNAEQTDYTYFVDVFGFGKYSGTISDFIDGNAAVTIDLSGSTYITVTGTIYDGSNAAKSGALVTFTNASTTVSAVTDANGNYSAKIKAGTYTVSDSLAGYVPVKTEGVVFSASTSSYDFGGASPDQVALQVAGATIEGVVSKSGGGAMTDGFVWAENASGTMVSAPIDPNDGSYSLAVTTGTTWTIFGVGPLHEKTTSSLGSLVVNAGVVNHNFALSADAGNVPTSTTGIVTANAGGSVNDSSASGIKLTVGAGVLESGNGDVTLNFEKNYTAPNTASYEALGNASFSINATGNSSIKTLSGNAEIQLDYTTLLAELPVGVFESDLKLAYYSPERDEYVTVEGGFTVDPTNNTISGLVDHFTDFVITYTPVSSPESSDGITVTQSDSSTAVTEGGSTDTVTYVLTAQPSANVVITPSASGSKVTLSPTSLTFTSGNWSTPQVVTVTAVNDATVEGAHSDTLTHVIASGDAEYGAITLDNITVSITDNDSAPASSGGSAISPIVVIPVVVATSTVTSTVPVVTSTILIVSTTVTSTNLVVPAEKKVSPVLVPEVSSPDSKVLISVPVAVTYQPGTVHKFSYQYKNETAKKITVKVVRQILDSKGKAVKTSSVNKTLKAGAVFKGDVKEVLAKTLKPGEYTVRLRILGAKNKVLEENSFKIEIEKLKKKYLNLNGQMSNDSSITFDSKTLTKVKSSTILPKTLQAKYNYLNNSEETQKIKMIRELVNADGKVLDSKSGKWTVKAGKSDNQTFTQKLSDKLEEGEYSIRVRAFDQKSKELLGENILGFKVELK